MPYHRKTKEQFVNEAVQVHGDKYDYSEVEYVNTHKLVRIQCISGAVKSLGWAWVS